MHLIVKYSCGENAFQIVSDATSTNFSDVICKFVKNNRSLWIKQRDLKHAAEGSIALLLCDFFKNDFLK